MSVVNFWASWCAPCVQEHPLLVALKERTGVQLYGVNYKDQAAAARRFLGRYGNPFAAVGVDANGRAAIEWGVYGMPETFIVNGKGEIVYKHVGPISARDAGGQDHSGDPGRRSGADPLSPRTDADQDPATADSSEPASTPSRSGAALLGLVEGQHADEQAHGEADAAQHADAEQLQPTSRPPAWRQTAHDRQPGGAEDAERLADEQAERDAERHRLQQLGQRQPLQRHAGVGEGEQRQDAEGHPGMQALLQLLEQRRLALRPCSSAGWRCATTTPASVACTPDFSTHTQMKMPVSR